MKFGSWMGGDRDGNPNVTAKVSLLIFYDLNSKPTGNEN